MADQEEQLDREELIRRLEDLGPEMAKLLMQQGAHDPDWKPLEKVLPFKQCAGFMFMGYAGRVRMYKHGFTRRYLNVDPEGNTYAYISEANDYVKIPKSWAIKEVFAGLAEMGVKRTTPFDEKAKRERREAMAAAGYTTLVLGPGGFERFDPPSDDAPERSE